MGASKQNGDTVRLDLRIPAKLHKQIKRVAKRERRSLNSQLIISLEAVHFPTTSRCKGGSGRG